MEAEKPRWHRALDNLKQFTSPQARLEIELSDAHRELSKVRGEYLQLGLRCSALASERDALRQRVCETEQYVEALHTAPETISHGELDPVTEIHQQLTAIQQEIELSRQRYAELETQFLERGQKIEALQDRVAAKQLRETELVAELQLLQQRFDAVEQASSVNSEKLHTLLSERDKLRLDIADSAMHHHQQIEALQQQLDESSELQAELNTACQDRDSQIEALQDELHALRAKLSALQAGDRDREIAIADRDQEFETLKQRFSAQCSRAAELEAQYTELSSRASAAERAHAATSDGNRQQLELLQQRLTEVQRERDAAQQENQALQAELAGRAGDVEDTHKMVSALEWQLAEAARGHDALQDKLLQLENERKQLLGSEAELAGSLKKARNQRHLAEYGHDALLAARRRERWILWTALLLLLAFLAILLLKNGVPWRGATAQAPGVGHAQRESRNIESEFATDRRLAREALPRSGDGNVAASAAEPLVQAYLMGHGETAPGAGGGCAEWGIAGSECPGLDAAALGASVIHLDSGVKYKVVSSGTGAAPQAGDSVVINYRGTLLDGTEFDSSTMRGGAARFNLDELIPGLQEALQRMEAGARWVVYVPPELGDPAYSDSGGDAVVFDIELVSVGTEQQLISEFAAVQWAESDSVAVVVASEDSRYGGVISDGVAPGPEPAGVQQRLANEQAFFLENAVREGVISLPSGLQYRVVQEGSGRIPAVTDTVVLDYRTSRLDGQEFGSTTGTRQSAQLSVDELSPGLREALLGMREGERRELYIPHQLVSMEKSSNLTNTGAEPVFYDLKLVAVEEQGPSRSP